MVILAIAAVPGSARADERSELGARFTTDRPGTSSGLALRLLYKNPRDPNAKPPPIRRVVIELPAGTRVDTAAAPQCRATDDELRARGRDACPPETRVGDGTLLADTGFGPPSDPVRGDLTVFNGRDELIELVTVPGSGATAGIDRLRVNGSTLSALPPTTPGGPPDGETSVREIRLLLPARAGAGRALFLTPASCPSGGAWTTLGRFAFGDGASATASDSTPCRAPGTAAVTALRLRVSPRATRVGRRTRVLIRVTSPVFGCASRARVRLGRHTRRTNRRGRAVVLLTPRRARRLRVSVGKAGCGRATAHLVVRARRR